MSKNRINIIAHRGLWGKKRDQNTIKSLVKAIDSGFGVELDLRDYKNDIIISHDPLKKNERKIQFFKTFISEYKKMNTSKTLAINIKSDGLSNDIKKILIKKNITNYFVFDMSVPDMLGYLKSNLTVFSRHSEYENKPVFYEQANGIWIDAFENEWWGEETLKFHLEAQKSVCIVSPELHRRNFQLTWNKLSSMSIIDDQNLMLCTDYPEHARKFFYEKN